MTEEIILHLNVDTKYRFSVEYAEPDHSVQQLRNMQQIFHNLLSA